MQERALSNLLYYVHGVLRHSVLDIVLHREDELQYEIEEDEDQRSVEHYLHVAAAATFNGS